MTQQQIDAAERAAIQNEGNVPVVHLRTTFAVVRDAVCRQRGMTKRQFNARVSALVGSNRSPVAWVTAAASMLRAA